jgi:putative acetyltransferase
MESVTVRAEVASDHARVFEIQQAAFDGPAEAKLVDALRLVAGPQISLVAETPSGEVVGHIFFSRVEIVGTGARRRAMGLGPVGVDPAAQQRGIGSALCRAGLEACRALEEPVVFVLGHSAYYPRFGFEPARARGLFYKNEHFDGAFFALELAPGALDGCEGEVVYHPAFDAM